MKYSHWQPVGRRTWQTCPAHTASALPLPQDNEGRPSERTKNKNPRRFNLPTFAHRNGQVFRKIPLTWGTKFAKEIKAFVQLFSKELGIVCGFFCELFWLETLIKFSNTTYHSVLSRNDQYYVHLSFLTLSMRISHLNFGVTKLTMLLIMSVL